MVAIDNYLTARKHQETSRLVVTLCVCIISLKRFRESFESEADRIRARDRIKFLLVGIMFKYRRRMKRFGTTAEVRGCHLIRNSLTSHANMTNCTIESKTAREHLLPFLREYQYRSTIKLCMRNLMERILFIQKTFKR